MTTVEVITFNCFGVAMDLKAVLRRRGPPDAHRLAHTVVRQTFERADVVCMQEVWIPEAVELFEALGHEHKVHDANSWTYWPLTIAGSGLGVASRWPLSEPTLRAFECGGAHSDKLARKGWIHVRLGLGASSERQLDLFTTHLQAAGSASARRVRSCQLEELRAAVDELTTAGRPVLLCGDMNIDGLESTRHDEYASMAELFRDFEDLGAEADEPTMCPQNGLNHLAHRFWSDEPNQRIDYLLLRAPAARWLEVAAVRRVLDEQLPDEGGPATFASDHFAVAVELRLADESPEGEADADSG
ncbi:MAG: endonuclease/exonuclease/phosphatase family protein [Deltaproteobacteria bacterium]|jgi:endonuclease/exonuclease/phosphatase family metal-dependent hydrolase|nr:endonuclease/exonuclease/phosphatase family protein [Deltaproteobacteria bacterium]MBW2536230.1 endonuclease/exonuclease/phosphatase family protein [Deltaproteobacteria bacterium]